MPVQIKNVNIMDLLVKVMFLKIEFISAMDNRLENISSMVITKYSVTIQIFSITTFVKTNIHY